MKISCNTMLYERVSNQKPRNAKFAAFVVNVVNFRSLTRLHITCLLPKKPFISTRAGRGDESRLIQVR